MSDEERLDDEGSENLEPQSPIPDVVVKILLYVVPILVSVILSVIIMLLVFKGRTSKGRSEEAISVQLQPKAEPLAYHDLGEFKINTADLDSSHFVRVSISLGYNSDNKLLADELSAREIQIRDIILNLLNSKEKSQMDEFLEKERLKEETRRLINAVLSKGEISAVYYTEFIIS